MKDIRKILILFLITFSMSVEWVGISESKPTRFKAQSLSSNIERSEVEFELKGYYYPDEAECGFSEIFLFTNKGFFRCDSSTAGINPECEEKHASRFLKLAERILKLKSI